MGFVYRRPLIYRAPLVRPSQTRQLSTLNGGLLVFLYTGVGAAVYGGAAALKMLRKIVGAGGAVLGGAADVFPTFTFTGSGGITFRGFSWIGRSQEADKWTEADWS